MLNKITGAQLSMLHAATTRADRLLTRPANARTAAVKGLAGKLLDAGWVKEVKARGDAPVWRKDLASDAGYALKLTAKGLRAAAAAVKAAGIGGAAAVLRNATQAASAPKSAKPAAALDNEAAPAELNADPRAPTQTRPPHPGSKLGRVLDMLEVDAGATIGELTAATGWLEHTTRAALMGLRRRGFAVTLSPRERDGASVYRIVGPSAEAAQ